MLLTVEEAAVALRMRPSTVKAKLRVGLLPGYKLGGSTSPWRVDIDELKRVRRAAMHARFSADAFEVLHRTPSEVQQFNELTMRIRKLNEILGTLQPVRPLLDKFGAKQLDDLHPKYYASFRAGLLKLTRGLEK